MSLQFLPGVGVHMSVIPPYELTRTLMLGIVRHSIRFVIPMWGKTLHLSRRARVRTGRPASLGPQVHLKLIFLIQ